MYKLFTISTLAAAMLFFGCSKTTAFDFFSTNTYYEKAVSNLQKVSLMSNLETKALLHVVYLNNVDPKSYNDGEYFFVALHVIQEPQDASKKGLNNPGYTLKMQAKNVQEPKVFFEANETNATQSTQAYVYQEPLEIKELEEGDKLRMSMPIKSRWNTYYLVKYKSSNDAKLVLLFENDQYGKAPLNFAKAQ